MRGQLICIPFCQSIRKSKQNIVRNEKKVTTFNLSETMGTFHENQTVGEQLDLTFHDISYTIRSKKGKLKFYFTLILSITFHYIMDNLNNILHYMFSIYMLLVRNKKKGHLA